MMKFLTFILLLLASPRMFAQQRVTDAGLSRLLKLQDSLHSHLPIEKLYLQTDKSVYAVGDTIWLKGYLFDADYLKYSSRSGLMYVELANDTGNIVKRMMLLSGYGISHGQIAIDGRDIQKGSYTLRAYTNWQRNFGDDYIFTKGLYITSNNQPWLVNIKSGTSVMDGKENVRAALEFADADKHPVILRQMRLKVNDGSRTLLNGKVQTDLAGAIDINFSLPAKADKNNLAISVEDLQKGEEGRKINIPIVLNRWENTDLQFMPEGGNLVNGIPSKIGFKAVSEDGRGIDISGKVFDSKQAEVASFSAAYKGMGSFDMTPQGGETYTAKVTLSNGQTKTYPMPAVKSSGTVINIQNLPGDSLLVLVSVTADLRSNAFYFIGKAREEACYAQTIKFENNTAKSFIIPKNIFPSGIARFSLLNRQGQPLNERIVYIDHQDNLKISIQPNKQSYTARDSMALNIKVTDKIGKPIQGSFSLAVTDGEQVLIDSLAANLTTNLLLTSDLKGLVEEPGYYLQNKPQNKAALDNLLLTQGWVGYDWTQVTGSAKPVKYDAEPEFKIIGSVTNILGKPVEGSTVILFPKKSTITKTAKTDAKGRFMFNKLPIVDTALFFLQATNKKGKNFGIGVTVDHLPPPEFSKPAQRYIAWYVNSDTLLQRSVSKAIINRLEEEKLTNDHVLKQVEIKAKKIIPNSFNRNGPGEADLVLDERDMEKAGDMTLEEMLGKYLPAFRVAYVWQWGDAFYMSGLKTVVIIIDGVNTKAYGNYAKSKPFLDNYTAKDIQGIEVMSSINYRSKYDPGDAIDNRDNPYRYPYTSAIESEIGCKACPPARMYVEITTHSGDGPFLKKTPGSYVYRPLSFIIPKQFYHPRYTDKTPDGIKDLRPTIHWEPLVITDKEGKATVSFYASDRPGNYTVIVEGSDMNGNIGSTLQKIYLKK